MIPPSGTTADVLIVQFSTEYLIHYLKIASLLRAAGLRVEVYPEAKKLAHQFKYADRRGFKAVIVAGSEEITAGKVQVKWLADGSQQELACDAVCIELVQWLKTRTVL